jgi:hypothetical protein
MYQNLDSNIIKLIQVSELTGSVYVSQSTDHQTKEHTRENQIQLSDKPLLFFFLHVNIRPKDSKSFLEYDNKKMNILILPTG